MALSRLTGLPSDLGSRQRGQAQAKIGFPCLPSPEGEGNPHAPSTRVTSSNSSSTSRRRGMRFCSSDQSMAVWIALRLASSPKGATSLPAASGAAADAAAQRHSVLARELARDRREDRRGVRVGRGGDCGQREARRVRPHPQRTQPPRQPPRRPRRPPLPAAAAAPACPGALAPRAALPHTMSSPWGGLSEARTN